MPSPKDLQQSGLKATMPRMKILEVFETHHEAHLTADDVYRILSTEGLDIGLATIYRALTQFEQAGLLQKQNFESGKAVFELNRGDHHDHLVCLQCDRVVEFCDPAIEERQAAIAEKLGFRIQAHALSLYGECVDKGCPHRPAPRTFPPRKSS